MLAGCAFAPRSGGETGGYVSSRGWPVPSVPVEAALAGASAGAPLAPAEEPYPVLPPWRTGLVGVEYGTYSFTDDDMSTWFDDASYGGIKFAWDLWLNWGLSFSAGCYKARNVIKGGEDIEVYPVRATLELGGLLFFTQSRWFVGGGAGYAYLDELPSEDKVDLWPATDVYLDDEWTAHVVGGFEFRNDSMIAIRLEGGHAWLLESEVDCWMMTGTFSLQY